MSVWFAIYQACTVPRLHFRYSDRERTTLKDSRRSLKPFSPHLPHAIATQPSLNEERFTGGNDFVFVEANALQTGLSSHKARRLLLTHRGSSWRQTSGKKERKKSVFHGELCDTSVPLRQKKSQRILGGMQRTVASFLSQSFLLPF